MGNLLSPPYFTRPSLVLFWLDPSVQVEGAPGCLEPDSICSGFLVIGACTKVAVGEVGGETGKGTPPS